MCHDVPCTSGASNSFRISFSSSSGREQNAQNDAEQRLDFAASICIAQAAYSSKSYFLLWRFCTRCWTLSAASVTPVYSSKQHGLEISAESRLTLRTSEASYSSNRLETRWNEYHQPALKLSVRCQILFNFQWMTRTLTCHSHHPFTVAILGWLKKHVEILQNPAASAWHRNISQRNDHSTRLGTLMCEWPGVCQVCI